MTAIVGVLNSQGIAIAADSAVTVTGNNSKKVYNRSNKIFTLSKYHPVGIAIYNSADYMGMPLETLIKMYRKELSDTVFDTLEQYKDDFIEFLKEQLVNVSPELLRNNFFSFCSEVHINLINRVLARFENLEDELNALEQEERLALYHATFDEELERYIEELANIRQFNYIRLTIEEYIAHYSVELRMIENFVEEEIQEKYDDFSIKDDHKVKIKQLLFALINIELIFEKHCGLVVIGFGEKEIFPSSYHLLIGNLIANEPRIRLLDSVKIQPGVLESNILPYAQADVTTTVLTGVDPNYKNEVRLAIKNGLSSAADQIVHHLAKPDLADQVKVAMETISSEIIKGLEAYQWEKITGPLLEILAHMGKEDMSELAESLVNITSLKRKFTSSNSSDESVGGPVDVAIITKGDGFIWMKRKHYFEIENNLTFKDKYFKT
ncbi:hypothetical protein HZP56_10935 [Elizabethkingia anophelis]|nr:hypothetical protein [Elizabethkingia anophelis]MCT4177347.1 hypothetical protein [Elizabethkingia anophelis]